MPSGNNFFFLCLFVLLSGGPEIRAQAQTLSDSYSFDFRGEPLGNVLDQITRTASLDLVYDPQLVQGYHVYKRIQQQPVSTVLKHILGDFGLDYLTLSSGTIVIIKAVSEGPFFGSISGKITDLETGQPLPGATILLADASGGTSTGPAGNFSIPRLLSGTHTIIFSYVGYEPVVKTIQIPPDKLVHEQISLQPKLRALSPIVVQSQKQRSAAARKWALTPSLYEHQIGSWTMDAIRGLNMAAGVQYGLPMADLHLQGGQKTDHRILLDGIPVYNPTSFGQLFSAFSPYAIGRVELKKSGYGAEAGSYIGGVINFEHELPSSGKKSATLQTDPLSYNARVNLSFEREKATYSVMSALRSSFWNTYKSPAVRNALQNWDLLDPLITNSVSNLQADASSFAPIEHQSDVRFFDYHLAASVQPDNYSRFSGSFYIAENYISTFLLNESIQATDRPYLYAEDANLWNNKAMQLSWNKMFTPRLDVTLQGSFSSNRFSHEARTRLSHNKPIPEFLSGWHRDASSGMANYPGSGFIPLPTWFDTNQIEHATFRSDVMYSFSPVHTLQGGLQAEHIETGLHITESNIDSRQTSWITSSYLTNSHTFGHFWAINWGSRFTYLSQTGQLYAEPRVSVQYDMPDSRLGFVSSTLAGGLYRQFINEFRITSTSPTAVIPAYSVWSHAGDLPVAKAWHLNGSFLVEPEEFTTIQAEVYYKWHPVALITSYSRQHGPENSLSGRQHEVSAFAEATSMVSFGGGIRFSQSLPGPNVELLAGYDYSYSNVDMSSQFGRNLPASWNEPHRFTLRGLWQIRPKLSLIANWQTIAGRAWAFKDAYYNFLLFEDTFPRSRFSFDSPENDTLPAYHQLDVSLVYQPKPGPADMEIRFEIINLLNRKNVLDRYVLPASSASGRTAYETRSRTFPGIYPSASISLSF